MNRQTRPYLWLALGSALLIVVGWRWNVPIAAWLAPVFLIRFFRTQKSWRSTLVAIPVMGLGLFLNLTGSWDFSFLAELGISLVIAVPLLLPLYLDRYLFNVVCPREVTPSRMIYEKCLVCFFIKNTSNISVQAVQDMKIRIFVLFIIHFRLLNFSF